MSTLVAALALGLAAAVTLRWVRRESGGGEPRATHRRVATAASTALGVAAVGTVTPLLLAVTAPFVRPDPEPLPPPVIGAIVGLLAGLVMRVFFLDLLRWSFHWALRAPERFDWTRRMEVANIAWTLLAFTAAGAVLPELRHLEGTAFSFAAIPLAVAFFPLYQGWIHPWLLFVRSPRLRDAGQEELEVWLRNITRECRLRPFQVRVHEGREYNAYATGGLFRNLVVIGGGLAEQMTNGELKAVLAHEIAHVIRRDVLKLLAATVAGGALVVSGLVHYAVPYGDSISGEWGTLVRGLYAAVFTPIGYMVLPALVSRRAEFGADRLAAKLLGDSTPLAEALARLHELRNLPLDRKTLTHPTTLDRITALRGIQAAKTAW